MNRFYSFEENLIFFFKVIFLHESAKAHSSTPSSLSPGSVLVELSHFSQHMLKPLFKVRLPERADRLQRGFPHRVSQLLEEHPEKQQHEGQESEEHPHVQAQVPAPAQCHGQRGGRHQEFLGGRHGVRQEPALATSSKIASFPALDLLRG